jgi:hypothetical protein
VYDEKTGEKATRLNLPVLRPPGTPTPCHSCPKIPLKAQKERRSAVEVTDRAVAVWRHYRECRAVGVFPDDPIVRWNAVACRAAEQALERHAADSRHAELMLAVTTALVRKPGR